MRKMVISISALSAFIVLGMSVTPVFAPNVLIPWTCGWDTTAVTPPGASTCPTFSAFPASKVMVNHPDGTSMLIITYILAGANIPSTVHDVGLHVFLASTAACFSTLGTVTGFASSSGSVGFLGTVTAANCALITRQGLPAVTDVFELGNLALDSSGNGDLSVTLSGIASGTYSVEFDVRVAAFGVSGCPFCDVILQGPGPVYSLGTVTITIP